MSNTASELPNDENAQEISASVAKTNNNIDDNDNETLKVENSCDLNDDALGVNEK